ncbi:MULTISPECIES: LysR family transcriptional regulator [Kitasatospora]|uniref:Putative LysR family transcriptional regulator n=1 Tax=Kitasatospora setae (strain ATCC 33774 / DSM 43861 / JCM 3304 / KCC A-0304 / NBRC 14216 / KM-6054) TaxID=452652 RepID=E4N7H0_KITSK|nr:LysR family transcriptional regulator [Kitasatospora setae]BAJ27151.1 putative LysR family transcriptional regulator [Kitasatospora setae KM-6054]
MDSHLLRTLVTVARLGSFSAAALELGYTQSAVSQQIAALEAELGAPLLHRRPVAPTAAGERMLEHARLLLERMDAARADVRRSALPERPELLLAASPLALDAAVVRALGRARAAEPRLRIRVRVLDRRAVAAEVAAGRCALGVTDGYAAPGGPLALGDLGPVRQAGLGEEPCAVLCPPGHPLRHRPGVDLDRLADAHWLDAPGVAAPLDLLRAATGGGAFPATAGHEGHDPAGPLALAAAGHGLAVLPRTLAARAGAVALPVRAPRLAHRREVLFPPGLDAPARVFLDALPRGA